MISLGMIVDTSKYFWPLWAKILQESKSEGNWQIMNNIDKHSLLRKVFGNCRRSRSFDHVTVGRKLQKCRLVKEVDLVPK